MDRSGSETFHAGQVLRLGQRTRDFTDTGQAMRQRTRNMAHGGQAMRLR